MKSKWSLNVPSVQTDKQRNRDLVISRLRNRLISFSILCVVACLALSLAACGSGSETVVESTVTEPAVTEQTTAESPVQATGNQGATEQAATNQVITDQAATTAPIPDQTDTDDHSSSEQLTIHFTDSNEDIWPPQPINVTDVVTLPSAKITKNTFEKNTKITQALLSEPEVRKSLGDRFEVLAQYEIKNKTDAVTYIETEVFSYTTNQVITARVDANSDTVLAHTAAEAYRYQPPESQPEVRQAIALAEEGLTRQGFTDHLKLRGTGLLAYPTAIETAATGHQFFSERKVYVTFGIGNGELPQFRALVNLSNSTVESSGAIQ